MMSIEKLKDHLWIAQVPIIVFFTFAFWVTVSAEEGKLENQFLRETFYEPFRTASGYFTNLKFRMRGPIEPKNKIVVVEIDSQSLEVFGRWPWHRDMMSALIDKVFSYGAKTVSLDIIFSEPDPRVAPEVKEVLTKANLTEEQIASFETDPILRQVIEHYKDRLILGFGSEVPCQPKYEGADQCPVMDPEISQSIPEEFHRFAIQNIVSSKPFDASRNAMIAAPFVITNIPFYLEVAKYSGALIPQPDPDGYIRRTPLIIWVNGKPHPTLALATAMAALDDTVTLELDESQNLKSARLIKSNISIPTTPTGALDMNFRGPSYTFPYVSAYEILKEESEIQYGKNRELASTKTDLLDNAMVFIGLTAVGMNDLRAFPFDSSTPGVEGHATNLDNILSADALQGQHSGNAVFFLFALMTIGAIAFGFATQKLESIPALVLFMSTMSIFGIIDIKFLFANNMHWNTTFFAMEIFTIFFVTLSLKYVLEERNKKFIKGAFSKYVSPAVVDDILKDPAKLSLGGEKRELTIAFSDIRSFTTFSEKMDAKELAKFLNEYLGKMTDIVFTTEGTLDKYIGDAVMAFWGAPLPSSKHAKSACQAAVEMQNLLANLRPEFKKMYDIDVQIGIGINTGAVNVGNMGSDKVFEYTVIGDHVNLASRLEGLTKYYGAGIVTTRFTFDSMEQSGEALPAHRSLDFVKVKGKTKPIELIQVLEQEISTEGLEAFETGRRLYKEQKWDEAKSAFERANHLCRKSEVDNDGPSQMYLERIEFLRSDPPGADWDGSWQMTSK